MDYVNNPKRRNGQINQGWIHQTNEERNMALTYHRYAKEK